VEKIKRFEDIHLSPETMGEAGIENEVSFSPEIMAEVFKDKGLEVRKPFSVRYVVEREEDSDTVHAHIDVTGEIEADCARCLEQVVYPVELHLNTDYLPATKDMAENLEEERINSETGYYRKVIRLGEFIISELLLTIPLRFICDEDCRGLCAGCGANLNREECRCEASVDPRLQKLKDLKDKFRRK